MKILFAASEAVPFSKTGGLADVVGALPAALARREHSVRVVAPLYSSVDRVRWKLEPTGLRVSVPLGPEMESVHIWRGVPSPGVEAWLVESPRFFDRPGVYGPFPGQDYPDNPRRYICLSRAVLEIARHLNFRPDIVHLHDWQTALVPAMMKTAYRSDPFFARTATVYTIHNLAYQGLFDRSELAFTGVPEAEFHPGGLEFYGLVNAMKAGITYADAVNTVSPSYADEIRTDRRLGCALDGVLRSRTDRFRGIVNGIDVDFWSPRTDRHLAAHFDADNPGRRALCRADLQKSAELEPDASAPILGFVGRLDPQKGIDVLLEAVPPLLQSGAQFVSLGVGQRAYTDALRALAARYPGRMFVETDFADPLAHKIYGGADLFLMPSRFEPCGLSQLIAMRYGAIPVVSPTGGLLDTVGDVENDAQGRGFVASDMSAAAFLQAARRAITHIKDAGAAARLRRTGMTADFSWTASVVQYERFYELARLWRQAGDRRARA